jgi:cell division protein FtsI/penicillin-binding protein 2
VKATLDASGKSTPTKPVKQERIVKQSTSSAVVSMMEYVFTSNHVLYSMPKIPDGYIIGGKTGTAQIAKQGGGYFEDKYNGTFMGFVGGKVPDYTIFIRVNEPGIPGYAGSKAAAPIFSSVATMLINNFNITPGS